MTTPCLTLYPTTTPRTEVFDPFVIISNSDDEITTLPIRPAPPSPDRTPAWYGYPLNSSDGLSGRGSEISFAEIEQIVAQRVANAIETIAIYEAKTRVARDLMNRVERQKDKVAENASNKRKWEGDHGGSSSQQQNKEHKVIRAHTAEPDNKKGFAGNLPLCNKCKFYHTGLCAAKCSNCKRARTLQEWLSRKEEPEPSEQAMERKNLWRL
ncbi:hypothetical protein Tco_0780726 [Tanacetum coccineum]